MSFALIRVDAAPLPNVTGRGVTARQESRRKLLLLRNITGALADCEVDWIRAGRWLRRRPARRKGEAVLART